MKNVGNSSRGRSQEVQKIFRAPMYRAHWGIARLSLRQHCQHSFLVTQVIELAEVIILDSPGVTTSRHLHLLQQSFKQ